MPPSMKNAPLTPSISGDMGMGDQLKDDVEAQIAARRKKSAALIAQGVGASPGNIGLASSQLGTVGTQG